MVWGLASLVVAPILGVAVLWPLTPNEDSRFDQMPGIDPISVVRVGLASMLAGLVQAPSAYDPIRHLSTGRLRQQHVLHRLVTTGVLSAAQSDTAE